MRIDSYFRKFTPVSPTGKPAEPLRGTRFGQESETLGIADRIQSKVAAWREAAMRLEPETDAVRVHELRSRIQAGEYTVDARELSRLIVAESLEG